MKKHWNIVLDPTVNPATPIDLVDGLIRVYCPTDRLVSDETIQNLITHLHLAMEIKGITQEGQ